MAKINADDEYFLCIGYITHTAEYLQYLQHFGSILLGIKIIISSMTSKHASITMLYDKIGWNIDFHGLINCWSHTLLSLWLWVKKASASHWVWCWRFLKRLITGDALFRGGFSSLLDGSTRPGLQDTTACLICWNAGHAAEILLWFSYPIIEILHH